MSLAERLRAALRTGDALDLSDQALPADDLRSVLLDRDTTPGSMLYLHDTTIDGALLLSGAQLPGLVFERCTFTSAVGFADCSGRMLTFDHCELPSLSCPALALDGSLQLTDCVVAEQVDVSGARVGGRLVLDRTRIASQRAWPSFAGDDLLVGGTFDAFTISVTHGIALASAKIGGHLRLGGAILGGGGHAALAANGLHVGGSVDLRPLGIRPVSATGAVELEAARIDASLFLNGAVLHGHDGVALAATFLRVGEAIQGAATVPHPLRTLGTVNLQDAKASGVFLSGAQLDGDGNAALIASGAEISGPLFCGVSGNWAFTADGKVELISAHVGGQLGFSGAQLRGGHGEALVGDGMRVDRGGFFTTRPDHRFSAEGELRMYGATIEGALDFRGARLSNADRPAFSADGITVHGDALFEDDDLGTAFTADGAMRLSGCRVTGQLGFIGAELSGELELDAAEVGSLWLRCATNPSLVDLTSAKIEALCHWTPAHGLLQAPCGLRNTHYDTLDSVPRASPQQHLAWLARDPDGYSPQPYEELASAYARAGHEEEARAVLIAKQRRRRSVLSWRGKVGSWFLGATVAHGYRSSQAAVWLFALLAIGAGLFGFVFDVHHDLTPARDAQQVPGFQPIFYTLDVLLPVIDLGQATAWNAHGAALWVSAGLALSGWLLTAALVAGIAVKRR